MTTDEIFTQLSAGKKWTETLVEMVEWLERKYATATNPEDVIANDYPTLNAVAQAFYESKEIPAPTVE